MKFQRIKIEFRKLMANEKKCKILKNKQKFKSAKVLETMVDKPFWAFYLSI